MGVFNKPIAIHFIVACLTLARIGLAQDPLAPVKPYDGIQAGLDAYRLAEEKRQGAVNQQIGLNDQLRYWNGYPTSRGETIYYGYMSPAALANHGYGAYGYGGYGYGGYGPWTGFQLGPWIGGGIWGTPYYYQPARQPIGQTQIQIGPNHWESHPVYDPPLTMYRPQPPVDSPLLDRTPYATPPITLPTTTPPATTTPATTTTTQPTRPLINAVDAVPPPAPPAASQPAAVPRAPREY
ncbi:MAG TPA: hypothetical protein VGI40_14000 [Pirellulaceae bacterium]|jgi:hypothetical protein